MTCRIKLLEDERLPSLEKRVSMLEENVFSMRKTMDVAFKAIFVRLDSLEFFGSPTCPVVKKRVRFSDKVIEIPYSNESLSCTIAGEVDDSITEMVSCAHVEEPIMATAVPVSEGNVESEIIVIDVSSVRPEAAGMSEVVKELEPIEFIVEPRPMFISAEANPDVKIPGCVIGIQHLIATLGGSSCEGFFEYLKQNRVFDAMTSVIQIWPEISFAIEFPPEPPKKPPPWFEILRILIYFSDDFVPLY